MSDYYPIQQFIREKACSLQELAVSRSMDCRNGYRPDEIAAVFAQARILFELINDMEEEFNGETI